MSNIKLSNKILVPIFLILMTLPLFLDNNYILSIAVVFLINSILALSVNFLTGYIGVISLGQAAFYGLGAYTTAILSTKFNMEFIPTLVIAFLITALFGAVLGLMTIRVKGRYLPIITLAVAEIAKYIALNWTQLTNGPAGIYNIPKIFFSRQEFRSNELIYLILIVVLVLVAYFMRSIVKSRHGRAMKAIKDDEIAARSMGVESVFYKILTLALSAGIASIAGVIYAHYVSFIDPSIFDFNTSLMVLAMAIIGGLGSIPGSIAGAFLLTLLPEILRFSGAYRFIIFGIILLLFIIFKPSGLMGRFKVDDLVVDKSDGGNQNA